MSHLNRDAILRHRPPRYEDVPVPELATKEDPKPVARIQALTASEVDRFLGSLWGPDGKYNRTDYAAKLLVLSWVDEQGKRVLTDGDVAALGQQESGVVQRLAIVAERLSGLQAKQVESAAGN